VNVNVLSSSYQSIEILLYHCSPQASTPHTPKTVAFLPISSGDVR